VCASYLSQPQTANRDGTLSTGATAERTGFQFGMGSFISATGANLRSNAMSASHPTWTSNVEGQVGLYGRYRRFGLPACSGILPHAHALRFRFDKVGNDLFVRCTGPDAARNLHEEAVIFVSGTAALPAAV
jgi:hypothetical protein